MTGRQRSDGCCWARFATAAVTNDGPAHAWHHFFRGPELRDWDEMAHLTLKPQVCCDAAAYAGIEF